MGDFSDPAADAAEPDDSQGLARDLSTRPARPRRVVTPRQFGHHPREMLGEANHEGEDVFADALRVRPGRVDDLDSTIRGCLDVDLVIPHTMPADDLQILAFVHEPSVDHPSRSDHQRFGAHNLALEGFRVGTAGHAELTGLPKQADAGLMHLVDQQDQRRTRHWRLASRSDGLNTGDALEAAPCRWAESLL